jgi:hypothetical protein
MIQMHADAILAAGNFRGIGGSLHDARDEDRVAPLAWCAGDDDAVTDTQIGVGGEARVY